MKIFYFISHLILISLVSINFSIANAGTGAKHPIEQEWPFDGFFGKFDYQAIQRGFQVYKEVCSACHGIKRIAFRNFEQIGFSKAEVKALAAGYNVIDGPNDDGEMFERPGVASDYYVQPYKNEKAARAANLGSYPVDLSLITKARHDGPNYVYSLLTGYQDPPAGFTVPEGKFYNPYMDGHVIAMPPPLSENQVTFQDGTKASVHQMAHDVVQFLQWAAEPELEQRKSMGIRTGLYLIVFTVFFFFAYRRIWKDVK